MKEKLLLNISALFPGIVPDPAPGYSSKELKVLRQTALKPLVGQEGSQNLPFLYVPPKWDLEENGDIKQNGEGEKVMLELLRNPFYSPYILKSFHLL